MQMNEMWPCKLTDIPIEDEHIAKLPRVQDFDVLIGRILLVHNFIDVVLHQSAISCGPVSVHITASNQRWQPDQTRLYSLIFYLERMVCPKMKLFSCFVSLMN